MTQTLQAVLGDMVAEMNRRSEIVEPWQSYWYYRPLRNFPPPTVRDPEEYQGGERLALACTQTNLPAGQQKALVEQWCRLLPTLSGVRILWFNSKVTQPLFEAACAMPNLQGLYVKWSSIDSLAPLRGLQQLTHLHVGGAPSAEGLHYLSELPALIDLEIHNVRAAADLSFLAGLPQLRSLGLAGDGNSSKALRIQSLAPLRHLQQLERLSLTVATVEDGSLAPIAELAKLKHLLLSNQHPMAEYARLAARMPQLDCDMFQPLGEPATWMSCKQCGEKTMLSLTGKGKPWLCSSCDAARIAKHVAEFEKIVAETRQGLAAK